MYLSKTITIFSKITLNSNNDGMQIWQKNIVMVVYKELYLEILLLLNVFNYKGKVCFFLSYGVGVILESSNGEQGRCRHNS